MEQAIAAKARYKAERAAFSRRAAEGRDLYNAYKEMAVCAAACSACRQSHKQHKGASLNAAVNATSLSGVVLHCVSAALVKTKGNPGIV